MGRDLYIFYSCYASFLALAKHTLLLTYNHFWLSPNMVAAKVLKV